jgi:hypothetical protein
MGPAWRAGKSLLGSKFPKEDVSLSPKREQDTGIADRQVIHRSVNGE